MLSDKIPPDQESGTYLKEYLEASVKIAATNSATKNAAPVSMPEEKNEIKISIPKIRIEEPKILVAQK